MQKNLLLIFSFISLLPNCSFVKEGNIIQPAVIKSARSAYVVKPEDAGRDIEKYLEAALANQGLRVTSGPLEQKPKQVDVYVEYVDRWTWDVAMYLKSLDVYVKNNRNGELLATGNFHQGFPHSFPSPSGKCTEVIDSIFSKPR